MNQALATATHDFIAAALVVSPTAGDDHGRIIWLNGYDRQIILCIEGIDKPSKV